MSPNLSDFVYFSLVDSYLKSQIAHFQQDVLGRMALWAATFALVLVTLWVTIQGYRMITGQSREPMMTMVGNMAKIVFIVSIATSLAASGNAIQQLLTTDLAQHINYLLTGSSTSPDDLIDQNLAKTQVALAAIDVVQVAPTDIETTGAKARATLLATFGTASPPMVAGAMLLLYQFAIALFIGLGPLFILCLIFDQTKELFRKWLMYGIGTLFSMAMLAVVTSIAMRLCLAVTEALWSANVINNFTGYGSEGLSSLALQQGGIGLLMTALIISVPPMAGMFFQGTLGSLTTYSVFGGGASRPGPQGQPPSAWGGYFSPPSIAPGQTASTKQNEAGFSNPPLGMRAAGNTPKDEIKPYNPPPGN